MKKVKLAAVLVGLMALGGCIFEKVAEQKTSDPIVHPTDEQRKQAVDGEKSKDEPYVPWWAQ